MSSEAAAAAKNYSNTGSKSRSGCFRFRDMMDEVDSISVGMTACDHAFRHAEDSSLVIGTGPKGDWRLKRNINEFSSDLECR